MTLESYKELHTLQMRWKVVMAVGRIARQDVVVDKSISFLIEPKRV